MFYCLLVLSCTVGDAVQQVVPCEKLEPGPVVTLKRVVATLRVLTFFCGWNRMMWTLGAKRQPSTTDPLRLTEMHIVVVCTWRRTEMKQDTRLGDLSSSVQS